MKKSVNYESGPEYRNLHKISKVMLYVILIFVCFIVIIPLLWLVFTAFKTEAELASNAWGFPQAPTLDNYREAFASGNMVTYFVNSVKVSVLAILMTLLTSSMIAFVLARIKFKLRRAIYYIILIGMMIPIHSVVIPIYITTRDMGLHNSLFCLSLVYAAFQIPFSVFILHGFMTGIPVSLEEAATLDGCGPIRIFLGIIIPLSKEGLVTVAILTLMSAWNELLISMLLVNDVKLKTMTSGLMNYITQFTTKNTLLCAGLLIACLPNLLMYAICQESMIKGMTLGAVKE